MRRFKSPRSGIRVYTIQYGVTLSVIPTGKCLISYGTDLLRIDRATAAIVLRKARAGIRIEYLEYGENMHPY